MGEFKGTTGEWRLGNTGGCVVSDNEESLNLSGSFGKEAKEYYGGNLICESVSNANAKLIVAAPEMLKALKLAYDLLKKEGFANGNVASEVLKSIKKATE